MTVEERDAEIKKLEKKYQEYQETLFSVCGIVNMLRGYGMSEEQIQNHPQVVAIMEKEDAIEAKIEELKRCEVQN